MPSISNCLSCGPISLSNSRAYDIPEQPPPFTPMRRKTVSGRFWACLSCFTCLLAFSDSATAMPSSSFAPRLFRCGRVGLGSVLVLVVGQRRLDGVLGQHRAVDLDRRQLQLVDDIGVLDLGRLVHGLALQPFGGPAARGD